MIMVVIASTINYTQQRLPVAIENNGENKFNNKMLEILERKIQYRPDKAFTGKPIIYF
jgi:hypothetical protein